jgi:NADPH:quinone reductase-like Zn-dependent oxidoreductase
MKAAVVTRFDQPPRYQEFAVPQPEGPHQLLVDVLASGLHPRVRSQADGSHYTSTDELPLVPGIDGVGRDAEGRLRYFVLPDTAMGAMAEQTVIDRRRSIELPEGTDPVLVAAAMNPAMSSWVALRRRITFEPGRGVMVLGATGNAGRMALQIARHLGASRVVAVGRGEGLAGLRALGADEVVDLTGDADHLAEAGKDVDVVLDYLWGEPAAAALRAIVPARTDDAQALTWVQIGSVAGPDSPIPSAALRATGLQIVGSGQGSVPTRDILAELPSLAAEIGRGSFTVEAQAVPLADVDTVWTRRSAQRVVITP